MDALSLARWQFGITTVYHFLFIPITIGLSLLVAGLQTAWVRTGDQRWLRLTKFYGKLFLINFAMGVVTGIVLEFQFGMNWSAYSRFVGDIFGAPLAMEGLLAFFLESTAIGLWIFGWDRLPKRIHLMTIWFAAIGTAISAYFILAANSWMQWPVGYVINPKTHRAELTNFWAVLTNKVVLVTYPHTLAASLFTAGALVAGVALWHLVRRRGTDTQAFRSAAKLGAITTIIALFALLVTGDIQGKIMTETQPMKMAAAEALYETKQPAAFSLFTIGSLDGSKEVFSITLPRVLSFLATADPNGKVQGINNLREQYRARFGDRFGTDSSYTPIIPLTYWSFRLMMGFGALAGIVAVWMLWAMRRGRAPASRWLLTAGLALPLLPLLGNSLGWMFTEMGRQPWIVFSAMFTDSAVSPTVSLGTVITSLVIFTVVYGVLAVIEVGLLVKYAKEGLPPEEAPRDADDVTFAFAY
jgi:cytochrome bd ubiquinol oxidase subunit I